MVQKACSYCAKVHYLANKETKVCYDTNHVLTYECVLTDKSPTPQVRSTSYRRKRRWIEAKTCADGGVNACDPVDNISIISNTKRNRFHSINSAALSSLSSLPIVTRHHSSRQTSADKWTRNVSLIRLQQKCSICSQVEYVHVSLGITNPNHKKLLCLNSITNSYGENNVSCNNSLPIDNCIKFNSISDENKSVIFVRESERQLRNCDFVNLSYASACCCWKENQRKSFFCENLQHSCFNQEQNSKNVSLVRPIYTFTSISTDTLYVKIEKYFVTYNEQNTWAEDTNIKMNSKVRTSNSVVSQAITHQASQTFLNENEKKSKKSKLENVSKKSVERTFHKSSSNCLFLLVLYLCAISGQVMGAYTVGLNLPGFSNGTRADQSNVCPSMDIRNTPKAFVNLTRCRVVEGFLMISLMDKFTSADFENITFPLLTEITDYLLVYRINGLQSLGRLFPNLSVIRGNALFEGFAMIIYENMNLEEIALKSLTYVKRGAVRVEKNPKLCFVETVDWTKIAVNATLAHFQKENKMQNECPVCPGESGKYKDKSERADVFFETPENLQACPLSQGNMRICWNRQNCQKVCPDHCGNRACNDKGQCCDDSCIGSCAINDTKKCAACRYFTIGNGECVEKCPKTYFKYMDRRCVTFDQCRAIRKPLNMDTNEDYPFIPFNGLCSTTCPANYEKVGNKNNAYCRRCEDKCIKRCGGGTIDSLKSAEKLRGCTIVTGSLLISIRQGGSHVIEELERSLSSIEEIEGFLKIARSYSIVSLSFLRGLRTIKGDYALDANKYALYVLDNQNLQSLFNENQTVTIEKGKIFFHFNPKLCYYKIEQLRPYIRENGTFDKADVAEDSNGDRIACNVVPLEVNITKVGSEAAVVSVKPIEFEDDRVFLGYQYYYIEAPHQNISIYDSRDGCGNDAWNLDDDTSKDTFHLFSHLKPFTQYAYYVKTYTIASESKGGQSPIQYFWTNPDKPERVRNLQAFPNGSSEIVIKWDPPKIANGNLTTYVITARLSTDDNKLLDQRNYCSEPIKEHKIVPLPVPDISKTDTTDEKDEKGCSCARDDYRPGVRPIEVSEVENVIEFEDAIQNFVYVKREERNDDRRLDRRRRGVIEEQFTSETSTNVEQSDSVFPSNEKQNAASGKLNSDDDTISRKEGDYYSYFYTLVNVSTRAYVLRDLKHYSSYTISVKACREGKGDNCSLELITTGRTLKIVGADDVSNLGAVVESTNTTKSIVRLTWKPPDHPNSMIVSYYIKYHRVDIEHSKTWEKCITQREYLNLSGYTLIGLETGNYSVQVMATSLAGDGNFTSPKYFYIPETRLSTEFIWGIAIGVIVLVVLVVFAIYSVVRKKCVTNTPDLKLFTSVNPEYISMQYKPDEWELERDQIIQYRELGQGSFGMVYEGIVKDLKKNGRDIPCAIKTVNESATDRERINFLNEASVMKAFDTYHVVRLLGVVSRGQPTLVVMELMTNGDLKGYLRSHRPDSELLRDDDPPPQPPTLKRILQMAIEIADGMAYLSAKKFVHRDLAARNCMVAEDLTVKIGDFGMTRDIYETDYYRKGTKGLLPVRWMAPESLKDGVFTSASDVFSYGVVLWEMATLASQPYQGLSNDQVLRYVIDGGVMERPENCPDKLYDLMRKCWQHRPSSRPSFMEIIQSLLDDADTKFRQVSFFHSDEGQEILDQMHPVTDIDDVTTPLRLEDDEFKIDVDNFLMERTDSHLGQEQHQNSPYSFGSAVITKSNSSMSGGESQSHDLNNPPVNMNFKSTVKGRRNNSAAPARFPGMEFLRNTFLKSSSFNNNGGIHGIDHYNGFTRENIGVNAIEANSGCSKGFGSNTFSESARNFFSGLRAKNGNSHNETKAAIVAYVGNDSISIPSAQFLKDYRMMNQMSEFDSCVKLKTKPSYKSRSPFQSHKTTENPNYGALKHLGSSSPPFIPRTCEQNKIFGMNQVAACNLSNCIPNKTQVESASPKYAQFIHEQKDLKEKCSNQCEKTERNAHINGFVLLSIPNPKSALQDRQRLPEQKDVECIH